MFYHYLGFYFAPDLIKLIRTEKKRGFAMVALKAVFVFISQNLLFTFITLGAVGVLFGPDIKSLFEKILQRKKCPHCGAKMELVEEGGNQYWSCTNCQVKIKAN